MPPTAPLTVEQDLANWLNNQPRWLKHAANSILTGQELDPEVLKAFAQTAFEEANGTLGEETIVFNLQSLFSGSASPVQITSISDVSGIGQLNPRNPLKFGNSPITAIFGSNGSGKSSYVRILKQVCGARLRGEIHRDVFAEGELPQSCKLTYKTSSDEETVDWDPSLGIIQGLSTVDIFDAHCGHSYLANEGKATYEPRALQFLSELAALCDQISARFGVAMEKRPSKLPSLPTDYRTATIGVWYQGLSSTTPSAQIEANCTWTEDHATELAELTKTLAERSPEDRAKGLRKRKEQADSIHASLNSHMESLSAFNAELSTLGAKKIRVELVKTRVSKGVILHQVRLKGSIKNKPIQEVLSEGEHRIVCLAAFLADSVSNPNGSTFVFDDPISSLDLDFEENVVQRLVTLSQSRPVVVFTHRLSLLGMLKDYTKKADIEMTSVNIRREPWGAGEPGDEAIESDPPKKGLNHHLPSRIAAAKLVYEAKGSTVYMPYAQSICTETRKIIERLVEFELLGDVIQRHRRAINTMGKLEKLASISVEDCEFIDRMMTKYSRYEHAQSSEAPVELPEPDELATDVKLLKDWRDELERRRKCCSVSSDQR